MDFLMISLGLFVIVLSLLSIANSGKSKKLPPGPTPLPIIGNLHKLGDKPHQSLAELAKIYGPIMSLKLGRITTIVISSSSAAKEVLQKQDLAFSSRHIPDALHAHNHSQVSVSWLPVAARWRSLRKVMTINIFSSSRLDSNQHLRSKKVNELIDYCHKSSKTGEAVDIGRAAFRTTLNLLSNTIFSKDMTDPYHHSASAKELKQVVSDIMVEAGKPNLVDYFPVLKKIDPQGIRRRMTVHFGKVIELFDGLINERVESMKLKATADYGDVLDSCLNIIKQNAEEIDRLHTRHMFLVLVKETLRIHPPVPLLLPRKVESDVELNGFIVPKDSQVLVNVWAIGRDPSDWEDPLSFNPERFLTSELDVRGQNFELIPFGAGRRICPGLPMAIRMVPVMLGSLINSFHWELDGGIGPTELDMDERFGITLVKAQPLRAIPVPLSM